MEKIFILGIGAQKAGTTWLFEYLKSFAKTATGPYKEYHVWDALHIPEHVGWRVKRNSGELMSKRKKIRARMQRRPSFYFDYFNELLERNGSTHTFDITPSYSALDGEVLSRIVSEFASRGIDCRVVFLMRDPVERCLSALKMKARNRKLGTNLDEECLERSLSTAFRVRTRYDQTLKQLDAAVGPEKAYVGIFEEMFDPERIAGISAFLGLEAKQEFASMRFNSSSEKLEVSEDTKKTIANEYAEVYRFVGERFPQVGDLWPGIRYLT